MASSPNEYIELYSKTRNRILYPNPSSFIVPYSPTNTIPTNPVINGTIYYKFSYTPGDYPTRGVFTGILSQTSDLINFYLQPNVNPFYPSLPNFFVGYQIKLDGADDIRIITSYDPSSGRIILNKPWSNPFIDPSSSNFRIYLQFPTLKYISIPTIDLSGNIGLDYEGAYNGYYVIFETKYKAYSNEYNSNIFYRKITYYDNKLRLGYFDKPIPFDYKDIFGYEDLPPQTVTLRQTLPLQRWLLEKYTYYNTTIPSNPSIGPLIGPVITLPEGASNIDNYYKGKYVYYYSNNPYYGNFKFDITDLELKDQFFPIYGFYFIKAYNGKTRELSVDQDINNTTCGQELINIPMVGLEPKVSLYNSSSIIGYKYANVINISGDLYRANITLPPTPNINIFKLTLNPPGLFIDGDRYWKKGTVYTIKFRVRKNPLINYVTFYMDGIDVVNTYSITNDFLTIIERDITITGDFLDFNFLMPYTAPSPNTYIEWDYFEIFEQIEINITDFKEDSYSPLDYIGSVVSSNQDVCYEVSLSSLTLPNLPLKTGSKISFYPYVYVELSNITSPNHASNEIIYSNNPNSNKALFVVPVGLLVNPNTGTFLTLYSDMKQLIKFKPNDNLKFSVYLPNGEPFDTFLDDTFPPYDPDSRVQIEAVFQIVRKVYLN